MRTFPRFLILAGLVCGAFCGKAIAATEHVPYITGYSPLSGRAGDSVIVQGSGFTGVTSAWIGNGHDAKVKVDSDSEIEIMVPSDASSGAVAVLSATNAAFSPTSFTVIGPSGSHDRSGSGVGSGTIGGNIGSRRGGGGGGGGGTGTGIAVKVSGNKLVDANGTTLQLRGVNYSGYEFTAIQGWDPTDPSGGQAGQTDGPNLAGLASWKVNALRIPLNEASWLGYSCTDTGGAVHNPDPGANYKSSVEALVANATAAGIYVILDLHWAAPGSSCPMLQTQMADNDHSIAFWTSVATQFKTNPGVIFELYNEPFFNFGAMVPNNAWTLMMQGGTISQYPATGNSGVWKSINTVWTVASMQAMLNAVRAAGASNVVLVGGVSYCNDLSSWLANMPSDSAGQLAASWHPYPPEQTVTVATISSAGSGFKVGDKVTLPQPNTVYAPAVFGVSTINSSGGITGLSIQAGGAYLQTSLPSGAIAQSSTSGSGKGASFTLTFGNLASNWSMPTNWSTVQAIAAKVPIVITETGEHDVAGTVGAPFMQQLLPFSDTNNWSVVGWSWDMWGYPDNVLITDVSGTPTSGYGQVFHDWMTGSAYQ